MMKKSLHPPSLHLAIIPDGNRRWAKGQGLLPWNGHERAIENFRAILDWCRGNPRIGVLTLWCFSTENWKRDPKEVVYLMRLFEDYLRKERPKLLEKHTKFLHSGRRDRLPKSLAVLVNELEEETWGESSFTLHLAIDYGGKDEIIRAAQKARGELTEESFRSLLDHPELRDIDLILRTSGEQRTSNFFLWQTPYSEWIFLEKYFPELTTDDLDGALVEFDRRTRRFGE